MNRKLSAGPRIVEDNEAAVAQAISEGNYVQAFLLIHVLVESLLRVFLNREDSEVRFHDLINAYEAYLATIDYPVPTFVDELTKFNQRRNKIVHQLWMKGYTATNKQTKDAATVAVLMYGLLIEWLGLFYEQIGEREFKLSEDI
ncbi:MAG: hypothetical protein DDT32_02192 [Syntrophomonadaceae bacterium]|nr:hypothetical protein [Bacillota bacterium]MBT9148420.1 hypothetical protein [Bacillota bacterium]